jgi:hypothetical protein
MSKNPVPPPRAAASAQSGALSTSDASQLESGAAPLAVRVQLLATEHWSLLATRTTAQSEVLSRITTFLMLVSSSIVGLALIGQFTRFDGRFIAFALVLLGALVVIGTLTQLRVGNASLEDLAHVIGMNRLRAAYVEIDPTIQRYLVTSPHDDHKGVWQTYNPLVGPNQVSNVLASSGTFSAPMPRKISSATARRAIPGSGRDVGSRRVAVVGVAVADMASLQALAADFIGGPPCDSGPNRSTGCQRCGVAP